MQEAAEEKIAGIRMKIETHQLLKEVRKRYRYRSMESMLVDALQALVSQKEVENAKD